MAGFSLWSVRNGAKSEKTTALLNSVCVCVCVLCLCFDIPV